jgi:hypothetical protein
MADGVFNIAKGRIIELWNRVKANDPAASALVVVLLKANEAEAALIDRDDLGAVLGAAGTTEADFTNYARKVLTDTDLAALAFAPDDANDRFDVDLDDQTWTAAGGAANNTLTKLLVCYDADTAAGTDADIVPLAHYDFAVTTDGNDLIAQFNAAGILRAS